MVRDEYGYEAGPDGFGTDAPPEKGWSIFGYFGTKKEAAVVAKFQEGVDPDHIYRLHPRRPGAVIWSNRKRLPDGTLDLGNVRVRDPLKERLARARRELEKAGALKKIRRMNIFSIKTDFQDMTFGPEGERDVREIMAAIKRGDYIPPILVSEMGYLQDGRHRLEAYKRLGIKGIDVEIGHHPSAQVVKRGVGRTMENPKAKDALVVGDDYEVYEEYNEGENTTLQNDARDRMPPQEAYDDYWDMVYEELGAHIRKRDDAAYKLNRDLRDWYVEVSGFGWRSQSGYNIIDVSTFEKSDREVGIAFLRQVLPNTDCTFYVYDDLDGAGLKIDNAHHDRPTGGEWYHAAPLAWMLMNGFWFGIQEDRDEILEEIMEVLLWHWEEYLNEKLKDPSSGGRLAALDIEFGSFCKQFLAQYKMTPQDKHLDSLINDLQIFFDRYYAEDTMAEWTSYLRESDIEGVEQELSTFLSGYDVKRGGVDPADIEKMRRIYDQIEREG